MFLPSVNKPRRCIAGTIGPDLQPTFTLKKTSEVMIINRATVQIVASLLLVVPMSAQSQAESPTPDVARLQSILRDPTTTEQQKQIAALELRHAIEIRDLRDTVATLERRNQALTEHAQQIRLLREAYSKLLAERGPLLQKLTEARDGHLGDKRLHEAYLSLQEHPLIRHANASGIIYQERQRVIELLQPGVFRVAAAQLALEQHDLQMARILDQIIRRETALQKASGQPE